MCGGLSVGEAEPYVEMHPGYRPVNMTYQYSMRMWQVVTKEVITSEAPFSTYLAVPIVLPRPLPL